MGWEDLSFREKAEYIKVGVRNGIKSIDGIHNAYNKFDIGGPTGNQTEYRVGHIRVIQQGANQPVIVIDHHGRHVYPAGTKVEQRGSRIRIIRGDTTATTVTKKRHDQQVIDNAQYEKERAEKIAKIIQKKKEEKEEDKKAAQIGLGATASGYLGKGLAIAGDYINRVATGNSVNNPVVKKLLNSPVVKAVTPIGRATYIGSQLTGMVNDTKQAVDATKRTRDAGRPS